MNTRRIIFLVSGIAILILIVISIIVIFKSAEQNKEPEFEFTGGSGVPTQGYLILRGYEVKTNSDTPIALGTFLTSTQQRKLRSFLETVLFKDGNNKEEYEGDILPGTVEVDHTTSTLSFTVEIVDPEVTYSVTFNTLSDEMTATNEAGEVYKSSDQ